MKKRCYISFDIEASNKTPITGSMLSLGATIVGHTEEKFYIEFKPLHSREHYDFDATRIGSSHLECIQGTTNPSLNPSSSLFDPRTLLDVLQEKGIDIKKGMQMYADWIAKMAKKYKSNHPIAIAGPIKFDGMWTSCYFDYAGIENPFRHSGEDMNSLFRGLEKDLFTDMKKNVNFRHKNPKTHHAFYDAKEQAILIQLALDRHNIPY